MKINIYQSLYDWQTTIKKICPENKISSVDQEELEDNKYYEFEDIELHSTKENRKVIAKVFCKRKVKEQVEWQKTLTKILNLEQKDELLKFMPDKSKDFDAIIIFKTSMSNAGKIYFTTFGQSYHDIDNFINREFGIDFAEKTIKNENVVMKNVNYFQHNKVQEVTNYRRNSINFSRPNESYTSVKGNPQDLKRYGKSITCSKGVTFNISLKSTDISSRLCDLLLDIDEVINNGVVLNKFPRISVERDEKKILLLEKMLLEQFKKYNTDHINISQYFEYENKIIFLDQVEKLEIYLKNRLSETKTDFIEYEQSYIDQLSSFITNYEIENLKDVLVRITDNGEHTTINIIRLLQVELNLGRENYLLQDDKWGTFNTQFLDLLNSSLENIEVKFQVFKNIDNYKKDEDGYINKFIQNGNGNYKKLHKNFVKSNNINFRMMGQGIELGDIIDIDSNELFSVKMGLDTSLSMYCLEQNMLATSTLAYQDTFDFTEIEKILNKEEFNNLKTLRKNSVLWVLPFNSNGDPINDKTHSRNVKNKIFKLTDLGSVLLKNKIVEWHHFAIENRMNPVLYLECPIKIE